jgi:hypothetical protein
MYPKTEGEGASDTYSNMQLEDFALPGMHKIKNMKYEIALQLYSLSISN